MFFLSRSKEFVKKWIIRGSHTFLCISPKYFNRSIFSCGLLGILLCVYVYIHICICACRYMNAYIYVYKRSICQTVLTEIDLCCVETAGMCMWTTPHYFCFSFLQRVLVFLSDELVYTQDK